MIVARFLPVFSSALCIGLSAAIAAEPQPKIVDDAKLAALVVPQDPLKIPEKTDTKTSTHIQLVLVGDTGYAPHGVRPNPKGVSKHGSWQTWEKTTRRIRSQINGDINFANIETVISANGRLRSRPKAFNFMMHPNGAEHLVDIGFNLFSMANNHSFDFGAGGIRDSLKYAERLKTNGLLAHAGIGLNRTQAAHVPVFSSKDTRFAFGAIGIGATYGGLPRASDKRPGQLGINNKSDVRLLMSNLQKADADYRILSLHRGYERIIRVDGNEIFQIRKNMLEQGDVDLLIGHHAHVTRGVEINNGRLIFYGLGNFLHQGTANMAKHGRCKDYSIMARVHLVRKGQEKPQLAAVEVVPITETHKQTRVLNPRRAAKSVAVLNGLARQFDNPASGAKGVRFAIRGDGTGLYCTPAAAGNKATSSLCLDYDPQQISRPRVYRAALSTCGRSYSPVLIARRSKARIAKVSKPALRPQQKLAVLNKPLTSSKAVESAAPIDAVQALHVRKGKPIYDAGLLRPDLSAMTKQDVKTYWTLVWYARHGKKPPAELVQRATWNKPKPPVTKVALLDAWNKLKVAKVEQVEPMVEAKPKPDGKLQLATAWAALGSKKVAKKEVVVEQKRKPDAKVELAAAWNALVSKKKPLAAPEPKSKAQADLAEAWAALSTKKAAEPSVEVQPKPEADTKLALAAAWNKLKSKKVRPAEPVAQRKPKPDTKVVLAAAWAALGSGKPAKPAETKEVVAKLVEETPTSGELPQIEKEQVEDKQQNRKVIYDAGLVRPNFSTMNRKQINAYWTRVWYARRDLRRKKRAEPTS